jgi:hypothetical protein
LANKDDDVVMFAGKSRALEAFSWLETLETVGKIVEEIQSTNKVGSPFC